MADTITTATDLALKPLLTVHSRIPAPHGTCYGRALIARNERTGQWDRWTARLIDTSARTAADLGPYKTRDAAEYQIIAWLKRCRAFYGDMQ